MNIREKLSKIQEELDVPKKQWNKFGEFWYRSCEDILEACKPVCQKYKTVLTLEDYVGDIAGKIYITAIATLHDLENDEVIENRASARESEIKKGMDASQLTGTASSYARKYALNGLFCLDDVKDADTDEHNKQTAEEPKATEKQQQLIQDLYQEDVDSLKKMLNKMGKSKVVELTVKEASEIISSKKQK
ncbi:MAG: ERF family protein [bacterium]|nr:ERF family protein [bacterium]